MTTFNSTQRRIGLLAALVVIFATTTACDPPPVPVPAPGCDLDATAGVETRTVDGREYHLVVPPGITGQEATGVPLLLALHGLNVTWQSIYNYTDFKTQAATEGYVVAYPQGINNVWAAREDSSDVTWLRHVIADIEAHQCINPSHVHVTGHSLGAYMAQRMACDADDVVASVSEYAGGSPTLFPEWGGCNPSRDIAVFLYHGTADGIVNVSLGRASRDQWIARNGCDVPPSMTLTEADGHSDVHANCDGNVLVTWREFAGQNHLWPSNSNIESAMWSQFELFGHPTRFVYQP